LIDGFSKEELEMLDEGLQKVSKSERRKRVVEKGDAMPLGTSQEMKE
jgi:hypothetical protein